MAASAGDQMDEALAAMKANGIQPAKLAGAPPGLLPTILRLPNWLFRALQRACWRLIPKPGRRPGKI
jgi:2-dehydropantoate 2-reductase